MITREMITRHLMRSLVVLASPVFVLGVVCRTCQIWFLAGADYAMRKDVR